MREGRKKARVQSGTIHVYIRGNSRHNVFYDDLERIVFLKHCQRAAETYNTIITEFAMMDNHFHMQIETENLSLFVKSLLQGYVQWYNRKNGLSDKLFKSPFNSSSKYSTELIIENKLYILQNPLAEGMCEYPSDYKWSSYKFHFGQKTPLSKYLSVDTSYTDNYFKSLGALNNAIIEKSKRTKKSSVNKNDNLDRITDAELAEYIREIILADNIFQLNKDEITMLIKRLYKETNASFRQISSLTHENYDYVRKICGRLDNIQVVTASL